MNLHVACSNSTLSSQNCNPSGAYAFCNYNNNATGRHCNYNSTPTWIPCVPSSSCTGFGFAYFEFISMPHFVNGNGNDNDNATTTTMTHTG